MAGWLAIRVTLCISVLAIANPAMARAPATIGAPWTLESDESYSYYADYRAPAPRHGLVLHGYDADDSILVDGSQLTIAATKQCPNGAVIADPRHLPAGLPDRASSEFWYFRTADQALFLQRGWNPHFDNACRPVVTPETRVLRIVLSGELVTFIDSEDGAAPTISTGTRDINRAYYFDPELLKANPKALDKELAASPNRKTDPPGQAGAVQAGLFLYRHGIRVLNGLLSRPARPLARADGLCPDRIR